ncbi:hypothetical protein G7Z17_g12085 [Cylindrodendrum hubeiense]|uniref:C2H2-type domain-containing protein n=1 Tax=Cylindrodendrum hubeiense TaxID=595255 RepID=A0A9P5H2Q3_9HYPO|nr:hypothetical protein G7Z17_g12085 [Cylindrodendrum hubeiense]
MDQSMPYEGHPDLDGIDLLDGTNMAFDPNFQMDPIMDPMAALHSLNQSLQHNWNQSLNDGQILPSSDFIMPWNPQAQWLPPSDSGWGAAFDNHAVSNLDMAPPSAFNGGLAYDDGASIACTSHCGGNCASQCDEAANANCCFDEACTSVDINHAVCCFDEACGMPEPCLDDDCTDSGHTCTDSNCMVPTVYATPASLSVPTPPTFESNPMVNPITSPFEPGVDVDPMEWRSTPGLKNEPQTLSADDQFSCRWVGPSGSLCNAKFENHKELQTHCKEEHLKDLEKASGGFNCSWYACTRHTPFSQKSKLERHMQTHTGFKPVACNICGILLSAKQSLEQHMRTHSGEKPWKCKFPGCTQSFKQQSALREKPLKCDLCDKRFSESSNLSKHRRTHNVKGGYLCDVCGKDFHRLDQLRRHMKTKHN